MRTQGLILPRHPDPSPPFLMEMFSLGGRQEARVPEEGGPTVPADVVVFRDQSHPGYDPPQRAQLWWAADALSSLLNTPDGETNTSETTLHEHAWNVMFIESCTGLDPGLRHDMEHKLPTLNNVQHVFLKYFGNKKIINKIYLALFNVFVFFLIESQKKASVF